VFVLDTYTLTLVHRNHPRVLERQRTAPPDQIVTSVITWIEILQGRFDFLLKAADGDQLQRAQRLLRQTEERLAQVVVLPVDAAVAAQFNRLRQDRRLNKIGRADLLIASVALAHRATLVTRNRRHFLPVPGLTLDDWTA
jgi:tRNA(fMet)-specific endonuclease VapC